VQEALDTASQGDAAALAAELRGSVRAVITSPHGNYVVQKIIEVLPSALVGFVADELRGHAAETAGHRYGCRVMSRLLEHAGDEPWTAELVEEALAQGGALCLHEYGHHVIESILEHGQDSHRRLVASILSADMLRYASDRYGTYVVKVALAHCGAEDTQMLVSALIDSPERLLAVMESRFGHHVIRVLLRLQGEASSRARAALDRLAPRLRASVFGCGILEEMMI
jgi:pumilio RNA-binding family